MIVKDGVIHAIVTLNTKVRGWNSHMIEKCYVIGAAPQVSDFRFPVLYSFWVRRARGHVPGTNLTAKLVSKHLVCMVPYGTAFRIRNIGCYFLDEILQGRCGLRSKAVPPDGRVEVQVGNAFFAEVSLVFGRPVGRTELVRFLGIPTTQ